MILHNLFKIKKQEIKSYIIFIVIFCSFPLSPSTKSTNLLFSSSPILQIFFLNDLFYFIMYSLHDESYFFRIHGKFAVIIFGTRWVNSMFLYNDANNTRWVNHNWKTRCALSNSLQIILNHISKIKCNRLR